MPSKREILNLFTRDELVAAVDAFDVSVTDRRAKAGLVEALAASRKATLAEVLPLLSRDRLKELCRALEVDDSGREKTSLVERLSATNGAGSSTSSAPSGTKPNGARSSAP